MPIGLPKTTLATDTLCEILKLTCNIAAFYPLQSSEFSASCRPILQMLSALAIPSPPLQPPVSSLINCLVFIVPNEPSKFMPTVYEEVHIARLIHILDIATQAYEEDHLDQCCSPLVQLLLLISQTAPSGIKALLQTLLLPTDKDREKVLGTDNSLPSRVLRLSTSITASQLRVLIQQLLFELSSNDEEQLVRNIGYGYASGFLHSIGKQPGTRAPANWNSKDSPHDSMVHTRNTGKEKGKGTIDVRPASCNQPSIGNNMSVDINPVTGQRRDKETHPSVPEMTLEEKEREAERLFVLFERWHIPLYLYLCDS